MSLAVCILLLTSSADIAPTGFPVGPQTLVLTVLRSFGLHSGLTPIRGSLPSLADAPTKMAEIRAHF